MLWSLEWQCSFHIVTRQCLISFCLGRSVTSSLLTFYSVVFTCMFRECLVNRTFASILSFDDSTQLSIFNDCVQFLFSCRFSGKQFSLAERPFTTFTVRPTYTLGCMDKLVAKRTSSMTYYLSRTGNYKSNMASAVDNNYMDNLREGILHCMARFGKLARIAKVKERERDLPPHLLDPRVPPQQRIYAQHIHHLQWYS